MTNSDQHAALECMLSGNQAFKDNQLQEALSCYSAGLELAPDSAGLFLNRSIVYERLENKQAALNDLDQYLQYAKADPSQNLIALKRFIALGIELGQLRVLLIRLQTLELKDFWHSVQFYEVLIGLLAQDPRSLETSLPHYLQRANTFACLSQQCLENALGVWQLHLLAHPIEGERLSSVELLMQLAMTPKAPQYILHLCLETIVQKTSDEDALIGQLIDVLSLWVQVHPMDAAATEQLIQYLIKKDQVDLVESLFLGLCQRFPQEPHYLLGLARARLHKRDTNRAFVVINAALDLDEKNVEVRLLRANIFQQLQNPQLALVDINQVLRFEPNHIGGLFAKINCLADLGRLDEALLLYDQVAPMEMDEINRIALGLTKSFLHRLAGNFEDAYAHARLLMEQYPDSEAVKCEAGWFALQQNDWQKGFALLENRFAPTLHYFPLKPHLTHAKIPAWTPAAFESDVAGKHLLLCGEEGMGDVLQFSRFIPHLLDRGLHITLSCKEALHPLLGFNFPKLRLLSPSDLIQKLHDPKCEQYDFHGEIMSTPWVLNLSVSDLSGAAYLRAMPEKMMQMAAYQQSLTGQDGHRLNIGLRWMSNLARSARSVPLEEFEPLSQMPINMIGLHYGPIREQDQRRYQGWPHFYPTELVLEDLAGLMKHLDCIVTSDTMTAHLAGALGRPTILLKPTFIDWRWGDSGNQSIWYDSMHIIRQTKFLDWSDVIEKLQIELQKRIHS